MLYKWRVLCIPIGSSVEKDAVICPWENQLILQCGKEGAGGGTGTVGWVHLGTQVVIGDNERRSGRPTSAIRSVPCQTTELLPAPLPPSSTRKLSPINQTQSIDSYLAHRSTNTLGLDRYGGLTSHSVQQFHIHLVSLIDTLGSCYCIVTIICYCIVTFDTGLLILYCKSPKLSTSGIKISPIYCISLTLDE